MLSHHLKDLLESFSLLLWVLGGWDRTRPPPSKVQAVQGAPNRLSAYYEGSLSKKLQYHKRATPARAQPTVLCWRVLFHQRLDPLLCQVAQKRSWSSTLVIVKGALLPFPYETMGDRVDGGTGAEKHPGDMGRAVAIRGEKHYVHPQPAARFFLTLHPDDEVLALFRSEGDTLHLGGCLFLWLAGFGVFTMPQKMAACSIILCIYLAAASEFMADVLVQLRNDVMHGRDVAYGRPKVSVQSRVQCFNTLTG